MEPLRVRDMDWPTTTLLAEGERDNVLAAFVTVKDAAELSASLWSVPPFKAAFEQGVNASSPPLYCPLCY